MNALLIAFLVSLGAGTWIFVKLQARAGEGNSQTALIGAGISFVLIFILIFTLAHITTGGAST